MGKNYLDGKLYKEFMQPQAFDEINKAMLERKPDLDQLKLYQSTAPLSEKGSHFTAFAVRCRRMDSVRLGYIKTFILNPTANHVMMAYRIGSYVGSCDDGEFQAGGRLLRLLRSKRLKNVAIYVVRECNGTQLGPRRFELIDQIAEELIDFLLVNSVISDDRPPLVETGDDIDNSQGSVSSDI